MVKKWHVFGININNESSLERTHSCFILRKPHSKRLLRKARRTYKKEQRRTCFFSKHLQTSFLVFSNLENLQKTIGTEVLLFLWKVCFQDNSKKPFSEKDQDWLGNSILLSNLYQFYAAEISGAPAAAQPDYAPVALASLPCSSWAAPSQSQNTPHLQHRSHI